jgi:hypothetical protein
MADDDVLADGGIAVGRDMGGPTAVKVKVKRI